MRKRPASSASAADDTTVGMIVLMASMAPLTSAAAGSESKPLTHTPRRHQKWEPCTRQYNANLTDNHNHPFTSVDKDNVPRQAFHMGLMVRVPDVHNRYQGHPGPMDNETPSRALSLRLKWFLQQRTYSIISVLICHGSQLVFILFKTPPRKTWTTPEPTRWSLF